jgi:hypothetical protein
LTSEECIDALYESDRRRGIGEALKKAGSILKELQKCLENGKKEFRQEQEALEKAAIKTAEREYKEQAKQSSGLMKKLESGRALHTKADDLRQNGVGMQTRVRNERIYQEKEETIHQLENDKWIQSAHSIEAERVHAELAQIRETRLAALAAEEKRFQDALEREERALAEARRPSDERNALRAAYRAAAQKPPRHAQSHWVKLAGERPEI